MSSVAGLQKKLFNFLQKVLILAIFDYLGRHSKSIFSTYRRNFEKSLVSFLAEFVRNIMLNIELSVSAGLREVAVLQVDIFQNPWF